MEALMFVYSTFKRLSLEDLTYSFGTSADSSISDKPPQFHAPPWEFSPFSCDKTYGLAQVVMRARAFDMSKTRRPWKDAPSIDDSFSLPPEDFQCNFEYYQPFIICALEMDMLLKEVYSEFVPERFSEEEFWRRYLWQLELLKCEVTDELQALGTMISVEQYDDQEPNLENKRYSLLKNRLFDKSLNVIYFAPPRGAVIREHIRTRLKNLKNQRGYACSVGEHCGTSDIGQKSLRRRVKFTLPDSSLFIRLEEVYTCRSRSKSM